LNSDQNIWLIFKDHALETAYRKSHDHELRTLLRLGVILAIIAWFFGLILTYAIIPEYLFQFTLIVVFAISAPFLLILISTYNKKFKGYFHELAAFTNILSGLLVIYFFHHFPNGVNIMLMILVFVVFFGNYLYRLRSFMGAIATLIYIVTFQIYILYAIELDTSQIILLSYVAWLTEVFALTSGFISERNHRFSFIQQETINQQKTIIQKEKEESDKLLLNILPFKVAEELKATGKSEPKRFEDVTILFTDFQGFTELVASMPAITLVEELNDIFSHFDDIIEEEGIEKIETIGDAYLAACGLPEARSDHAIRCVQAAKRMNKYLEQRNAQYEIQWKMRIGIHSGPVVAGVVGKRKFAYDVFGDTINTASRIETAGVSGKINISDSTYELIKNMVDCEPRGQIHAKGKGKLDMYFVK